MIQAIFFLIYLVSERFSLRNVLRKLIIVRAWGEKSTCHLVLCCFCLFCGLSLERLDSPPVDVLSYLIPTVRGGFRLMERVGQLEDAAALSSLFFF